MATIDDVAKHAAVSKATVSRVLNNRSRVRSDTRARVLRIAKDLGYSTARSLEIPERSARNMGAILTLLPLGKSEARGDESSWDQVALQGIETVMQEEGLNLFVTYMEMFAENGDLPTFVTSDQVDGVFVIGGIYCDAYIRKLTALGLKVVIVGSYMPDSNVTCVYADNYWGAYTAVDHLLKLGKTKIAFVNGPRTTRTSADKLRGYMDAHAAQGLPADSRLVTERDFSKEAAYEGLQELWNHEQRPDAVFCASSAISIGVIGFVRDRGLSYPQDIAVVGYQAKDMLSHIAPGLTCVSYLSKSMGLEAGRRMVQAARDRDTIGLKIAFPTRLEIGYSCGAKVKEVAD